MNNYGMPTNKEQKNSELKTVIGEIVEAPIEEKDLNACFEQLRLESEVVYLRKRKVRRRKTGGIF